MMNYSLVLLLLLPVLAYSKGTQWAVLVCGSRGYFNYRHHADVCHAYHMLRARGVEDDHIITFLYDDVANDQSNPFPGKLYNRPSNPEANPVDVYEGCKKDYTGESVNGKTFKHVLWGEKDKVDGRVLESTEEDDVFINFVDHGAPGLVAFPSEELHATELIEILKGMHERKMFKSLVFYLEACESGSMFPTLPDHLNIYAVTAANARESSWGTYCPPRDDKVNGVHLNTCLGDEFSVRWMEDTDAETTTQNETLNEQFLRVRKKVKKSHVLDFGDIKKLSSDEIDDFLGPDSEKSFDPTPLPPQRDLVDSRDIKFVSLYHAAMRNATPAVLKQLEAEVKHRRETDELFRNIVNELLQDKDDVEEALSTIPPENPTQWECHRIAHKWFKDRCTLDSQWSEYSLKYSGTLLTLCEKLQHDIDWRAKTEKIVDTISKHCGQISSTS